MPFAYPPLAFFLYALIHELTSVTIMTLLRFLPVITSSVCIILFYPFSCEFFEKEKALFATLAYSLMPASFSVIGASGCPRFLGAIFFISGVLFYLKLLKYEKRVAVLPTGIFFGLAILTNAITALHLFMTFLLLFSIFAYGKYKQGLLDLFTIFSIGAVVSVPYWIFILGNFGFSPFYNVLTLHALHGLSFGSFTYFAYSILHLTQEKYIDVWFVLSAIGFLICLRGIKLREKNELFLLVWTVALIFISYRALHVAFPLSLLATISFFDLIMPKLKEITKINSKILTTTVLILICMSSFSNALTLSIIAPNSFVPTINNENIVAMKWLKNNTPENSSVVVIGCGETWVPAISERKCFGVHCGPKWAGNLDALLFYKELYRVDSSGKLVELFKKYDIRPSYIYISEFTHEFPYSYKKENTIKIRRSLIHSQNFVTVFKNKKSQIFKVKPKVLSKFS